MRSSTSCVGCSIIVAMTAKRSEAQTTSLPVINEMTPYWRDVQRLRNTLRCNALFSVVTGVIIGGAAASVSAVLATPHVGWVRTVGFLLVVFAVDVFVVAGASTKRLRTLASFVVIADSLWVGTSVALISLGVFSGGGNAAVGLIACVVGAFGQRQLRALRCVRRVRPTPLDSQDPPREVAHFDTQIVAPAAVVWAMVTDHELYGRLAPNLAEVRATTENGPGLQRVCSNRSGREWAESCTLWDVGRRFEVAVDTTNYPYPLDVMRGSWSVAADGLDAAIVSMDFEFRPRRGMYGRTFAIVMHASSPILVRAIFRGMRREATRRTGRGE